MEKSENIEDLQVFRSNNCSPDILHNDDSIQSDVSSESNVSSESEISDEDFQLDHIGRRNVILPILNNLLTIFNLSVINSIDFEIPHTVERKVDKLAHELKIALINNYHEENTGILESELIPEIRKKFHESKSSADKIHALTVLPLSWSCSEMELQVGCSIYLAQEAKKIHEKQGILSYPLPRNRQTSITSDLIKRVEAFYREDEISRKCPGSRDAKRIKTENGSITTQKLLLLYKLSEVYALYKKEYPSDKISFSKFCELRPKECVLVDEVNGAHNVCVCMYHQNIKLMLEGAKLWRFGRNDVNLPTTYKEILTQILCENPTENCFSQKCSACPGFEPVYEKLKTCFQENGVENISFRQWKSENNKYVFAEYSECNVMEYLDTLKIKFLDKFVEHDYVAKSQSDYVKSKKKQLAADELIVLLDFSENYTVTIQDEIQAHHWNQQQITIHPFAIYRKTDKGVEEKSFVVISENLQHDVYAVSLFQRKLITFIKSEYKNTINKIFYVSDGAASQYKNKSNFINLLWHYKDFSIESEWHFFATSHGKSACDAIGGTVKRLARRASLQKCVITNATELFSWAVKNFNKITFAYCTDEEHSDIKEKLKNRLEKAKVIPGTQKFHSFLPADRDNTNEIICKKTSNSTKQSKMRVS